MHGIVWSYNVSNGPKSTYTGINAQNLDWRSEKSDWTSISGASLRKELLFWLLKQQHHWKTCLPACWQNCDPQEDLLEPWKGGAADCHQVQHAAAETIWKEDCLISWTLFFISSWIDNKIQGDEHCCNCNILLGTFPFSEYLNDQTKSRKLLLLDYSIE